MKETPLTLLTALRSLPAIVAQRVCAVAIVVKLKISNKDITHQYVVTKVVPDVGEDVS